MRTWITQTNTSTHLQTPTYLFTFEHMFVEILLELLVGIVDAELLEGVLVVHLKTKDVQHSDDVSSVPVARPGAHQSYVDLHRDRKEYSILFLKYSNYSMYAHMEKVADCPSNYHECK